MCAISFDRPSQPNQPNKSRARTRAQVSLGIAERIAGFLSLGDLAAYFGLDELGGKVCGLVCFVV
jgi:hypothetical protein